MCKTQLCICLLQVYRKGSTALSAHRKECSNTVTMIYQSTWLLTKEFSDLLDCPLFLFVCFCVCVSVWGHESSKFIPGVCPPFSPMVSSTSFGSTCSLATCLSLPWATWAPHGKEKHMVKKRKIIRNEICALVTGCEDWDRSLWMILAQNQAHISPSTDRQLCAAHFLQVKNVQRHREYQTASSQRGAGMYQCVHLWKPEERRWTQTVSKWEILFKLACVSVFCFRALLKN